MEIKKAFICGYSTGASILLEFLLTSKDLALGGVIISGMSEVSDWLLKNRINFAKNLAKVGALSVLAWSISRSNSNTKELFKKMLKEANKGDASNILQYYSYSLKYNKTNQLKSINLPMILVYGENDKPFYQYAQKLHAKLPLNELIFLKGIQHQVPTKGASELNKIIHQFIQKIQSN